MPDFSPFPDRYWLRPLTWASAAACFCLTILPLAADHPDEDKKAGHSMHGEGFSEGPRQAAVLLPGAASLCHFPITTKSPEAQQFFDQGIVQLHGFWFLEAERSFRQVLKLDPEATMAYWGMGMSNIENAERAKELMKEGMKAKQDHLTPREKAWMQSLSDFYEEKKSKDKKERLRGLVRDWEQIVWDNPDDIEAKAFLVGRIWRNHAYEDIKASSHLSIDSLAKEVLAKAPQHPGIHHYRIHLWNHEKDERALNSAAVLGPSAPAIAHNWHMPGHTYSALGRHVDAAWQQEASARVDHAHMIRYGVMPDEIHNYAHNNGWLAESWSFHGRVRDALALGKNLVENPRIPRSKTGINTAEQKWEAGGSSWQEGRNRLLQVLNAWELWSEVQKLEGTPYLAKTGDFESDLRIDTLCCLARLEGGDMAGGLSREVALYQQLTKLHAEQTQAATDAEKKATEGKKSPEEVAKAAKSARDTFQNKIDRLKESLSQIVVAEKLALGNKEAAKVALKEVKGASDARRARWATAVGEHEEAVRLAKRAAEKGKNQAQPQAIYVAALQAAGKAEDAKKEFETLRKISAQADLDLPAFAALGELAKGDWRLPYESPKDLGQRPPLDDLGPAHWHPAAAPQWSMTSATGEVISNVTRAGKPVILIFFLGKKCTHCMEQLNAFAPQAKAFAEAGLPLLAVSTDSAEGITQTLSKDKVAFPFPILSNHDLSYFKTFRAYDDFEELPLHSTVLIDAKGRIRWQHTSFNPFMKPEFLLEEAKRLLSFESPATVAGSSR